MTIIKFISSKFKDYLYLFWANTAHKVAFLTLTREQKQELDKRIDDFEANPDNVMTWEAIRSHVHSKS